MNNRNSGITLHHLFHQIVHIERGYKLRPCSQPLRKETQLAAGIQRPIYAEPLLQGQKPLQTRLSYNQCSIALARSCYLVERG